MGLITTKFNGFRCQPTVTLELHLHHFEGANVLDLIKNELEFIFSWSFLHIFMSLISQTWNNGEKITTKSSRYEIFSEKWLKLNEWSHLLFNKQQSNRKADRLNLLSKSVKMSSFLEAQTKNYRLSYRLWGSVQDKKRIISNCMDGEFLLIGHSGHVSFYNKSVCARLDQEMNTLLGWLFFVEKDRNQQ